MAKFYIWSLKVAAWVTIAATLATQVDTALDCWRLGVAMLLVGWVLITA